jgi:hypothetical protein
MTGRIPAKETLLINASRAAAPAIPNLLFERETCGFICFSVSGTRYLKGLVIESGSTWKNLRQILE